jgi:hypothetical protein
MSSAATTAAAPRTPAIRVRDCQLPRPGAAGLQQAGLSTISTTLAWGLAPLFLAAHGASVQDIAIVAACTR